MSDIDRQVLFSNENFLIGMLQVVSTASLFAALGQATALKGISGEQSFLWLITLTAIALIFSILSAYFKHQYKMLDVKGKSECANCNLSWMRSCMKIAVIAMIFAIIQFAGLSWLHQ